MKFWRNILLAVLVLGALSACEPEEKVYEGTPDTVFIYLGLGYNNLSLNLLNNLDEMLEDVLPGKSRDEVMLVYMHSTARNGDYSTANPPCLMRLWRDRGVSSIDTLKVYENVNISADAGNISEVLSDVKHMFPARHYGALLSSHATGWLPAGYLYRSQQFSVARTSDAEGTAFPETKSVGAQSLRNSSGILSNYEIDIKDFAAAIPMKLDYLIFDACLMGCVEVAYELKDVCDKLVFSPTEVLTMGFNYRTLSHNLFSWDEPDLGQIALDYFNAYDVQSGYSRSATVSVVDCTKADALAECFASIVENNGSGMMYLDRSKVQPYFYDYKHWFYDLRDYALKAGASSSEMQALDKALEDFVIIHRETPSFFDVDLERCCGISSYIPNSSEPELNEYYRSLGWNKAVGLVK